MALDPSGSICLRHMATSLDLTVSQDIGLADPGSPWRFLMAVSCGGPFQDVCKTAEVMFRETRRVQVPNS